MIFSIHKQNRCFQFCNNILFLRDGTLVGVVLGHCVFVQDGTVKAKYFNHTLYKVDGHILAMHNNKITGWPIDKDAPLQNAWKLIIKIKDHNCPLVDPTNIWTNVSLKDHFK
jgi:hypothetical protein